MKSTERIDTSNQEVVFQFCISESLKGYALARLIKNYANRSCQAGNKWSCLTTNDLLKDKLQIRNSTVDF